MKRTVLVTSSPLQEIASVLTGYGFIVGMDHEGTITYEVEVEGDDAFELGRRTAEIEQELRSYFGDAEITSGANVTRIEGKRGRSVK